MIPFQRLWSNAILEFPKRICVKRVCLVNYTKNRKVDAPVFFFLSKSAKLIESRFKSRVLGEISNSSIPRTCSTQKRYIYYIFSRVILDNKCAALLGYHFIDTCVTTCVCVCVCILFFSSPAGLMVSNRRFCTCLEEGDIDIGRYRMILHYVW